MDEYGIGSAASMGLHLYEASSRGTGRTTRMVERLRDDDQVVCRSAKEAERIRRLLKDAGKSTKVVSVQHASDLYDRTQRAKGRTYFDHDWVHQYFVDAVKDAEDNLRRHADRLSGRAEDRSTEQRNPMNIQRRNKFPVEL